jgi:4-aminobutyrate aminotransferase-like enzyme
LLLPLAFVSAAGDYITDADGVGYLNFAAGLNVPCGSGNAEIWSAATAAAEALQACEDYASPQRAELSRRLDALMPFEVGGIQYYSSGTEAVEAGLRFVSEISPGTLILSLEGAYHGKTAGSHALRRGAPWTGEGHRYAQLPFREPCSASCGPDCDCWELGLAAVREALALHSPATVAAIVVEVAQGDSGARVASKPYLAGLVTAVSRAGGLVMVDEILTGMGRTGRWWAFDHFGIQPDIVTVGKGLANGLPISAVLITRRLAESVAHLEGGTSFGGNPVSCAAACATIDVIARDDLVDRAARIGECAAARLEPLLRHPAVRRIRVLGALIGIELPPGNSIVVDLYTAAAARRLLTTPTRLGLRLTPPLTVSDAAIDRAGDILARCLAQL